MWDYTDRWDPTWISSDELEEAEIDDAVRVVTSLKKKSFVPKVFGAVAFSKSHPRSEVILFRLLPGCLRFVRKFLCRIEN
jgi:hypothetical protein